MTGSSENDCIERTIKVCRWATSIFSNSSDYSIYWIKSFNLVTWVILFIDLSHTIYWLTLFYLLTWVCPFIELHHSIYWLESIDLLTQVIRLFIDCGHFIYGLSSGKKKRIDTVDLESDNIINAAVRILSWRRGVPSAISCRTGRVQSSDFSIITTGRANQEKIQSLPYRSLGMLRDT